MCISSRSSLRKDGSQKPGFIKLCGGTTFMVYNNNSHSTNGDKFKMEELVTLRGER
jgi:hypothetical protein